jgi:hypothetical protein
MKRLFVGCVISLLLMFVGASLRFVGHAQGLPAPTVDRVGFKGKIVVDQPIPVAGVTGLSLSVFVSRPNGSYSATFDGSNLSAQSYFDVRFRPPNGSVDLEAQNWQQG